MTEPLFFDTDCLSAFLWINNQSLLARLYPGRVVIPAEVYDELSNPRVGHLKRRVDIMKEALDRGLITLAQRERLWADMVRKRRRLGYDTFADFLRANGQ